MYLIKIYYFILNSQQLTDQLVPIFDEEENWDDQLLLSTRKGGGGKI